MRYDEPLFRLHDWALGRFDARAVFVAIEAGLLNLAAWLNAWLHRVSLQRMIAVTLIAAAAAIITGLWGIAWRSSVPLTPLDPVTLTAAFCLAVGAVGTLIMHRQRWIALVLLSVVGLVVSLAFVKFSAPDLALTQLLVEVVTIVLAAAGAVLPAGNDTEGVVVAAPHRRSGPRRYRRRADRGPDLGRADPAVRQHRRLVHRQQRARRRWHQRGECDPGRLPRLRYLGRDQRAGDRRDRYLHDARRTAADRAGA